MSNYPVVVALHSILAFYFMALGLNRLKGMKYMKIFLHRFKGFTFLLLMLVFSGNMNAQCSITGNNVSASALNSSNICANFSGCTTVYVGNGTSATTLTIDAGLNFTCLGAINLVVLNNATIVFGNGASDKLTLAEYSTITINAGGGLNGGNNCTASDRIVIGTDLVSTCDGHAGTDVSFADIVSVGGTGSAISNSPVCLGNAINLSATPPPDKGPYTYSWSGPGLSPTPYSSSPNYTLVASVSGDYVVSMKSTILNPANNPYIIIAQAKVVVNSGSTTAAPEITPTQPTCTVPTGTIAITEPTGMKYSINGLTYTNTSGIFPLLTPGTYSVTAKNSSGCISNATNVTIKSATNTWNGSTWSNGSQPIITEDIVFADDFNEDTDIEACSCRVNANVYVDINSGRTLTVANELVVSDDGNVLFKDKSSLVQINNVANTGKIEYERKISSTIRPTDYTYWSSPVTGFKLGDVYSNNTSGLFYSYGVAAGIEDWIPETSETTMVAGKGYIINGTKVQSGPVPPPGLTKPFFGVPNNGNIIIPVLHTGNDALGTSNLLGNPYPSALDADKFLADNVGVLEGTIYFWTHYTEIQDRNLIGLDPITGLPKAGSGAYAYTSDDYASYNTTGGVAGSDGEVPVGKIAAGQGFFATSIAAGTVTFNNTMRFVGNNIQFFKTKNPTSKLAKVIEKNRVWLNMTNTQGAFKQTLVGYITNATNDFDDRFDGESYDGNEFVDFYSVNQDKNLVIQGRALPFDENDEVPLGYRTTINGAFTISIDQVDGLLTNQAVFIEDKLTNTVFDLKSGNYTFNTVSGTFNDRFVLKYSNKTLGTNTFDSLEKTVLVSNKNKQIKINSSLEMINKVTVFDLLGRQIYQKANVNSNELSISTLVSSGQVVIVKTVLQNGQEVNNKIVY